jgi:hypothetical protein
LARQQSPGRLWPPALAVADAEATTILVDKFDSSQLKRPSESRKDRRTRFCCFPFKYPNRSHSNLGGIREFLLSPVKETSGRSALGSCNHEPLYDQSQ